MTIVAPTRADTDWDVFLAEHEHDETPCVAADRPAAWRNRCRVCGTEVLLCDHHKEIMLDEAHALEILRKRIMCTGCGTSNRSHQAGWILTRI